MPEGMGVGATLGLPVALIVGSVMGILESTAACVRKVPGLRSAFYVPFLLNFLKSYTKQISLSQKLLRTTKSRCIGH